MTPREARTEADAIVHAAASDATRAWVAAARLAGRSLASVHREIKASEAEAQAIRERATRAVMRLLLDADDARAEAAFEDGVAAAELRGAFAGWVRPRWPNWRIGRSAARASARGTDLTATQERGPSAIVADPEAGISVSPPAPPSCPHFALDATLPGRQRSPLLSGGAAGKRTARSRQDGSRRRGLHPSQGPNIPDEITRAEAVLHALPKIDISEDGEPSDPEAWCMLWEVHGHVERLRELASLRNHDTNGCCARP